MPRTKSTTRQNLLTFLEVKNAIKMAFGAKKGADDPESDPKAFQKHEDQILSGVELLVEYLGKNPYEIVEWGRKAHADTQVMAEAINKMDAFLGWLQKKTNKKGKFIPKPTAVTIRGNAMSLFKWNGIHIPTKNGDSISEKKQRDQKLGIDNGDKTKTLKGMSYRGDPEMKAFINAGLACGHRISDMVHLEKAIIATLLSKDKEYVIYRAIDRKENALIKAVFGRVQQAHLRNYLDSKESRALGEDRIYLFGDYSNTDTRIREKMETLLHQVYEVRDDEGNDITPNIITPHTLRSMCETALTNHKYTKTQVYQFTGHKDGEKYIELTDEQMVEMFQAVEKEFNLENMDISMQTKQEIQEDLIRKMLDMAINQGKRETLTALYSQIDDSPDAEQEDPDKAIEMQIAAFLTTFKESLYSEFLARIKTDLKLK